MDTPGDRGRSDNELDHGLSDVQRLVQEGDVDAAEEKLEDISMTAETLGLPVHMARARTLLGSIRLETGNPDAALELFNEAERLLAPFPAAAKAEAVAGIARCCRLTGRTMYGLQLLEGYLLELEAEGDAAPAASMRAYSVLVGYYQALGMMRQASNAADKAMKHAEKVDDEDQVACTNMNVARVLLDQGRYPEAVDAIEKAEAIYVDLDWPISAARARCKRGIVEAERGNLAEARAALMDSLEYLKPTGITRNERAYALDELGRVERLLENMPEAKARLKEARDLLDERDVVELGMNARELGLCLATEDADAAVHELEKALGYYQEAGASAQVATTMLYLGRILKERGQLGSAIEVFGLTLDPQEHEEV